MAKEWLVDVVGDQAGTGQAPDLDEVRRALGVLADPDYAVELRGLPSGRSRVYPTSELDRLVRAAEELSDDAGVYWTLNPLRLEMAEHSAARVADVVKRRWFLIDVDRVKTPSDKKFSATDAEKENARSLALICMDFLTGQGWPAPVLVDSGNGWHLLYRIDDPSIPATQERLRLLLRGLSARLDTKEAEIDLSVHNAARISKLPGTWARKGPNLSDRPWRIARLVCVPEPLGIVSEEQLKETLAALTTPTPSAALPKVWEVPVGSQVSGYGRKALESECGRLHLVTPGHLNNELRDSGFRMGQLVAAGLLDEQEAFDRLLSAIRSAGADDPEKDADCLRRAIEAGKEKPREQPLPAPPVSPAPTAPKFKAGESIIVRASEIKPERVEWLWPNRIPLGMLTTFAGVTSLGKTFMLCDIAARVSRGADWPDSGGECCPEGQVLFMTGEDSLKHTIVPRLIEAGADLGKIVFLKSDVQDRFTLADLDVLDEALRQSGGGFRFVAIDPPTAFLGDIDDHKNSELRRLLSPLKSWTEAYNLALAFVTHFNKKSGENVDAMSRVMGSVAWVAAVRAAHMFIKDQDDPDRRLFLPLKLNVAKEAKGLAYTIEDRGESGRVKWLGPVETTADETSRWTSSSKRKQSRGERAIDWLIERFREKRVWPSEELIRTGKEQGISRQSIWEAEKLMEIPPKKAKNTTPDGGVFWTWYVPEDWPPLLPGGNSEKVGNVGKDEYIE